jgi:hypothetical protein
MSYENWPHLRKEELVLGSERDGCSRSRIRRLICVCFNRKDVLGGVVFTMREFATEVTDKPDCCRDHYRRVAKRAE